MYSNHIYYFKTKKDDPSLSSSLWLTQSDNKTCPSILSVQPSRYLSPIIYANIQRHETQQQQSLVSFDLNLNLIPSIKYFCDVLTNPTQFRLSDEKKAYPTIGMPASSAYTSLKTVSANYINESSLQCDLISIKHKFEQLIRRHPIEKKFVNITIQIRAESASTSLGSTMTSTLVASANLYAFNCSYFKECSQCLSPKLGGSCVWCDSNAKCIFDRQATRLG